MPSIDVGEVNSVQDELWYLMTAFWENGVIENGFLIAVLLVFWLLTFLVQRNLQRVLDSDLHIRYGNKVAKVLRQNCKEAVRHLGGNLSVLVVAVGMMMMMLAFFPNAAKDPSVQHLLAGSKTLLVLVAFALHLFGVHKHVARVLSI